MISLQAIGLLAATSFGTVDVSWDTATLQLNETGRVVALQDNATGHNYAVGDQPFCRIETETRILEPSAVSKSGERISFAFPGSVKSKCSRRGRLADAAAAATHDEPLAVQFLCK